MTKMKTAPGDPIDLVELLGIDCGEEEGAQGDPLDVAFPTATPGTLLQDAIEETKEGARKGTVCPCCGQNVKLYRRKLHAMMALGLLVLVKLYEALQTWINVRQINSILLQRFQGQTTNPTSDFSKLAYWGLIEECPNDDRETRTSGLWKPSQRGIDFANGRIRLPSYVYSYNNIVVDTDGEDITIRDALGERFSYREMMNAGYPHQ